MLDGVLKLLLVAFGYSLFVVRPPEFAVVLHSEPASLQKQQKLEPACMFQMLILSDVVVEVEHARRETLLCEEWQVVEVDGFLQVFRCSGYLINVGWSRLDEGTKLVGAVFVQDAPDHRFQAFQPILEVAIVHLGDNLSKQALINIQISLFDVALSAIQQEPTHPKWHLPDKWFPRFEWTWFKA